MNSKELIKLLRKPWKELTEEEQMSVSRITSWERVNAYREEASEKNKERKKEELKKLEDREKYLREVAADRAENQSEDMYKHESNNPENKTKRKNEWSPFQPVPNCAEFKITLRGENNVLAKYGLVKANEPELEIHPYRNRRIKRYAQYQIKRLRKSVNEPKKYWSIAWSLMSRSNVFAMMAVSKSFPKYHRDVKLHTLMNWINRSQEISKTRDTKLKYKRVYIPKPDGRKRPLGIPDPSWRILLTQLNWHLQTLLSLNKKQKLPDWQHAYMPGKGSLTAWKEILGKVIESRHVYEFDLTGFFDNVPVKETLEKLKYILDEGTKEYLMRISGEVPENMNYEEEVRLETTPEDEERVREKQDKPEWREKKLKELGLKEERVEGVNLISSEDWSLEKGDYQIEGRDDLNSWWDFDQGDEKAWEEQLNSYKKARDNKLRGFPQGSNISPLLAVSSLLGVSFRPGEKIVMYADDGIIYSNRLKAPEEESIKKSFERVGSSIQEKKSGWVKKDGEWLKPLKFLGLNFDGELSSSTRSKKSLVLEDWVKELIALTKNEKRYEAVRWEAEGEGNWLVTVYEEAWGGEKHYQLFPSKTEAVLWIKRNNLSSFSEVTDLGNPKDVETGEPIKASWSEIIKSKLFGLIQSKLYQGSYGVVKSIQNFGFNYKKESWASKYSENFPGVNFANSTSYAFRDILNIIGRSKANKRLKDQYKGGKITLLKLNEERAKWGWSPLGEKWLKKWRVNRPEVRSD